MHRPDPRPAVLAGLLALGLAASAAGPALAGDGAPAPAPGRGVVMAAPAEAADTLRTALEAGAVAPPPAAPARPIVPLLLDTSDYGFGTSVVFDRMPGLGDLHDLGLLSAVQHVVVSLPAWPGGYEAIQPLGQTLLPEGCDLIVLLPGYPPTRAAAEAWNYLRIPLRLVLVVDGPPGNRAAIDELNRIRGLERVIAEMEHPSRSGFERLQRPLSFRVLKP